MLQIDIFDPVELQSDYESFSIRVTNCAQPKFSCRISRFSLISPKCAFLLCGYITFSPQERGETPRWDRSNAHGQGTAMMAWGESRCSPGLHPA